MGSSHYFVTAGEVSAASLALCWLHFRSHWLHCGALQPHAKLTSCHPDGICLAVKGHLIPTNSRLWLSLATTLIEPSTHQPNCQPLQWTNPAWNCHKLWRWSSCPVCWLLEKWLAGAETNNQVLGSGREILMVHSLKLPRLTNTGFGGDSSPREFEGPMMGRGQEDNKPPITSSFNYNLPL